MPKTGKEAASEAATRNTCPCCEKVLSSRATLRGHCFNKHEWNLDLGLPATTDGLEKYERKKIESKKRSQEKSKQTAEKSCIPDESSEKDIFGSAVSVSSDTDSDVEPTTETKKPKTIDLPESSTSHKIALTNWSPEPKPISELSPCVRKQTLITNPVRSVSEYLKAARIAKENVTGPLPSTSQQGQGTAQRLHQFTNSWPDRAKLPSIKDIIGYRKTAPPEVIPSEIAELAKEKFGWVGEAAVTPSQYVKGVIMGYDAAKRELLGEIRTKLRQEPDTPEQAFNEWVALSEWAEAQPLPTSPKTAFDD